MKLLAYCVTAVAYAASSTALANALAEGAIGYALLAALAVIGSIVAIIALWTAKTQP